MAISLTKDDISQLRRADSIVVRFDTREEPLGFSRIEGSIQAPGERRFTDPERLFEMPSNPVSVTNYGDDRIEAGCWIISPAKFVPEWATMLNLLRTGDELHSTFEADCNYHAKGDVRRQADAVIVDTFAMRVMRPSPSGGRDKLLVFNLGYQLTGRSDGVRIRNLYTAGPSPMTANAYRDALDRIVKVLSVPEWDSETIERVADIVAEVCDITSPITEDERIAFRNITRAWKAIGRDPMADHHDTCTCWRCECVRDVWMPINNQEKTP